MIESQGQDPSSPLTPERRRQIEAVVSAIGAVIADRAAIYLSAPITSGRRFLQRIREAGIDAARRAADEITRLNRADASKTATALRARERGHVIDPSAMVDFPDWNQADYHEFWCEVIRRFARTVVFADGWQESNGCATEFLAAIESRIPALDVAGDHLTKAAGIELLEQAVASWPYPTYPTAPITEALARLRALPD